ncbi:hypothetical protein Poli38472_013899 [Pythium oligandrum]|uniref:Uncharacterized protein n=1 Tax=Pythium oligandrum TaxID=41045 RepID=A0A8K1C2U8_PYTOL|nr:hypothetical protein Poli38472_013899 [Pythium oligandrum]|eukprot:TMW55137.1 hypothetical protein Poli38472_013899 [Pythium oligandrum]
MGGSFVESTRNWLRKLRGRHTKDEEARMLRPVALAGASRRSETVSQSCSAFATTMHPGEIHRTQQSRPRKAMSDGGTRDVKLKKCRMCHRSFVVCVSRYRHYCSLDCKSASLLDATLLYTDEEFAAHSPLSPVRLA